MAAVWRQRVGMVRSCLGSRTWPARRLSSLASAFSARSLHSSAGYERDASVRKVLRVSEEVDAALAANRPVVALESTIYTHGALGPDLRLEEIVREHGAVPAVIGILDGRPCVGLTQDEVRRMVAEGAQKVSRRDLAYLVGLGSRPRQPDQKPLHGGTTIAGTMVLARLAGIRVFGTGGLGGVHRGWHDHMDISADLSELGRTRVAVISSGCKGFLDIAATLEYLETQGVYVGTFADGQPHEGGQRIDFPAFWARESGIPSPSVVRDEAEAAAIVWAQERLGIETGLLLANPIPAVHEVPRVEMEAVVDRAVNEAAAQGFTGNRNTPFVLRRIRELTDHRSVGANLALVQANVERAAKVAVHLSALIEEDARGSSSLFMSYPVVSGSEKKSPTALPTAAPEKGTPQTIQSSHSPHTDILVAGSIAVDLSCDYAEPGSKEVSPRLHTSNPASIAPSVGGVGHNVALAAHRISPTTNVKLCSMVGEDIAGTMVLDDMRANGLDTAYVRRLGPEYSAARTAHYVAVNDADKNLVVAMADMAIFAEHAFPDYWASAVASTRPQWLVVDGNWSAPGLRQWIHAARQHGARVAFEPVSVAKAARLFAKPADKKDDEPVGVFPAPLVDLATPNRLELAAMHAAAREHGGCVMDDPRWFRIIDALGLGASGARDRFVRLTSPALTDAGVPVQAVQLLPYVPTLVTKLGSDGALLTKLLRRDDPLLYDRDAEKYLLVRAPPHDESDGDKEAAVGGVYMRLFPPAEQVPAGDVVSVNGVGDTFLGALVAGLAQGGRAEELVDVAQRAAVLTLRSRQAVSEGLGVLAGDLKKVARGLS